MVGLGHARDLPQKIIEDLNGAISRCLFQIQKEKSVALKPEQEAAVIGLLRGEDALAVLPTGFGKNYDFHGVCLVSARAEQTNFSIGYFTDQKYCRPTCRPSRYFYCNRTAVAAQMPSSF